MIVGGRAFFFQKACNGQRRQKKRKVLDQILALGRRGKGERHEEIIRLQHKGKQDARKSNGEQQDSDAYQRAHDEAETNQHLPPSEDEDHGFRIAPVNGMGQKRGCGCMPQRLQQAEPDVENAQ